MNTQDVSNMVRNKSDWFKGYFRFGLISKGIVYCLTGVIATMAAVGFSKDKAGKSEIFQLIYEQPFGRILLSIIALGLLGYSLLRFFQCFRDIEGKGSDAKGIAQRFGFFISGVLYLALGYYAGKLAITGSQGSGDSRQFMVGKVLGMDGGEWIIGVIGLIIIGNGVYQIYRGISGKFMKKIRLAASNISGIVKKSGTMGYLSRGITMGVIGYLVLHAAITANPKEAQGTEGAFDYLQSNFGSVLMAIIAIGLIGYGVFMFVRARYQRINVD